MNIDLNKQYAIVAIGDKQKAVFCQLKIKGNELTATIQNKNTGTSPDVESIELSQVLAVVTNIDPEGKATAYGQKLRPWHKCEKIKPWGLVNWWRKTSDYEDKIIRQALAKVQLRLVDKYKLSWMLQPLDIFIQPNSGKQVGNYATAKNDGDHDLMCLFPKEFELDNLIEVTAHECGHKLWVNLKSSLKSRWINYYVSGCKLSDVTPEQFKNARLDWLKSGMGVREYAKQLEDENETIFWQAIDWVGGKYNLSIEFIDILQSQGEKFKLFWPSTPDQISEINGLVSDYSKKNPTELFCESIGLFIAKQKLPEQALQLVQTSLKSFGKKSE